MNRWPRASRPGCRARRPRPGCRPSSFLGSTVTNTRPPPYLAAFSTRLPSISSRSWRSTRTCASLVAGDVDGDAFVQPVDRALHRLEAFPHRRARLRRGAAADRPGPGEMVVDLAPHDQGLAAHGVGKVRRAGGRGIGDHGQRGLQRMGKVAGMTPRLLGLRLAVREQLVDLLGQRPDFGREILARCGSSRPIGSTTTSRRTRRSGHRP